MATNRTLPLRASNHQVGGHFLLMEINDHLITKPLVTRERNFYEDAPVALKQFTPQYHGTIQVSFVSREDGSFSYVASSETSEHANDIGTHELKCSPKVGQMVVPWTGADHTSVCPVGTAYTNPVASIRIKHLNDHLSKQKRNAFIQKYIVLENLTGRFLCPCILDLKMGSRSHADTMSESKVREHEEKCSATTSKSLGVRINGMQLYNYIDGCYHMEDKYYGQKITGRTELFESLRNFFHNGKGLRVDVVERLIVLLKQLKAVIYQTDSYRFYGTSLLIIYEGIECKDEFANLREKESTNHIDIASLNLLPIDTGLRDSIVDVRMIDFANCTYRGCANDPISYQGPDDGYLLGLNTLISAFESFT